MAEKFNYPEELPVSARHDEILAALRSNRVIIVCGETGSGKTTQLPKIAMEAGFGAKGRRIACTQPRRLAAVTVAGRVAAELGSEVGGIIGFQHRFARKLSAETRVKFMTDGVLLAETRTDPLLNAYDVIIIDEAHERSLNVDFLLGILKRILARRRDLKLIISSATLDIEGFRNFFAGAPVLSIPGRLFPIETRYLPPADDDSDLRHEVARALDTLPPEFDTLVFLPGERDIRETADLLRAKYGPREDIIPLLASLPASEQQRAFHLSDRRRIILATNVAETSVTIPGVRAVIDSGLARISRYIHRTQVQRLQIERISRASARQRMGRSGRTGPGICIRLYSEEDFADRDEFTAPEIQRSSLAGVILTMLDLRLGDISRFPFIDPPKGANIAEGMRELIELDAIGRDRNGEPCLTRIGRDLALLPVEPRLARMLIEASRLAVLPRALPIVAAMSCDDPRRRPVEEREKAVQAHAKFRVPLSDFLSTLKLWKFWCDNSKTLSQSKLRKFCQENYLSYPKMREWSDLVQQLGSLAKYLKLDLDSDNGDDAALHRSLLTGLISRIGHYDFEERTYRGTRGLRFAIHPSSTLAKALRKAPSAGKPSGGIPEWIIAGELVDTSQLFARNAAAIDVSWIEPAARGIVKSHYHSPEWDGRSGFVRATEQVTLYGLVIVPARRVDYSNIDPALAREIFIRRGLIDCDFPKPPPDVRANTTLLDELRARAEKLRDPSVFDEDRLYRHFSDTIPAEIRSAPALTKWLRGASKAEAFAFRLSREDWFRDTSVSSRDFPDSITLAGKRFPLTYRHSPDEPELDGLTCTARKSDAAALRLWRSDWLVPGMLPEKLSWLISALPTSQRKVLTPIADTVTRLLPLLKPESESLEDALVRTIREEFAYSVSPEAWHRTHLPDHLRVRFAIRADDSPKILASGRDLDQVLNASGIIRAPVTVTGRGSVKRTEWDFGDLDENLSGGKAGWKLEHYPALNDEGDGVTIRLCATAAEAEEIHSDGVARLYMLTIAGRARSTFNLKKLPFAAAIYLKELNYSEERIAEDILAGAIKAVLIADQPPILTRAEFNRRLDARLQDIIRTQAEISDIVRATLCSAADLLGTLERDSRIPAETAESVQTELVWLTLPGFPRNCPFEFLKRLTMYLKAAAIRLDRARVSRSADLSKEARFAPYWQRYRDALADRSKSRPSTATLTHYRWLLEEFRLSLFAQELKTAFPVSEKRLSSFFTVPARQLQ